MKQAAAALLMLLVILLGGCRTPTRTLAPLDPADPLPRALMQRLDERAAGRDRMSAALSLALDAPDTRFRRPLRLAVERPGRMRMEILALFSQIAAIFVTEDDRYQFFDAKTQQIDSGAVTRDLLWRYAGVDLEVADAVDLLLGAPRARAGWVPAGAYRAGVETIVVAYRNDTHGLVEHFEFDAAGRLETLVRMDEGGAEIWRARFSDYRDVASGAAVDAAGAMAEARAGAGAGEFAFKVVLDFPKVDAKAELDFKSVNLAPTLSDALFRLEIPGAAREGAGDLFPQAEAGAEAVAE